MNKLCLLLLTILLCLVPQGAHAAMTLDEFKTQYQKLLTRIKDVEKKRDNAKAALDAYMADNTWRKKRNDELFEYIFSNEGISALLKKLDASMASNLNDADVISALNINRGKLRELYEKKDLKRNSLILALLHGCENKPLLGKNTSAFEELVEMAKKYQIQIRLESSSYRIPQKSFPSSKEVFDNKQLRINYDAFTKRAMNEILKEVEQQYRLYQVGDFVRIKTKLGRNNDEITGYIRAISLKTRAFRLSGGTAGGRRVLNFNDLIDDELVHFDKNIHDDAVQPVFNKKFTIWLRENNFQRYATPTFFANGFFPYIISHNRSKETDSKPQVEWASVEEFVAYKIVELLPTHIQEYFLSPNMAERMVYDKSLREYIYIQLADLKRDYSSYYGEYSKAAEQKKSAEPLYSKIVKYESEGPSGEYEIYKLYLEESILGKSPMYAMEYLQKAAKHNYHPAIMTLAKHYRLGDICKKNVDKAIELYSSLANNGNVQCMLELVDVYLSSRRDEHFDEEKANEWCCTALKKDEKTTIAFMENKAEAGNDNYSYALANQYLNGALAQKNKYEGIRWLNFAAEQGNLTAKWELAEAYYLGNLGISKDLGKARNYYKELEKAGFKGASDKVVKVTQDLAEAYYHGNSGMARDLEKARDYFMELKIAGVEGASDMVVEVTQDLAEAYYHGNSGMAKDWDKSRNYYKELEKAGVEGASDMFVKVTQELAEAYYRGSSGMTKDLDKALSYYEELKKAGVKGASDMVVKVTQQLHTRIDFQCLFVHNGQEIRHDVDINFIIGEHKLYQAFVDMLKAQSHGGLFPEKALEAHILAINDFQNTWNDWLGKVKVAGVFNGKAGFLTAPSGVGACVFPHDTTITILAIANDGNYICSWCKIINTGKNESILLNFKTNDECLILKQKY